MNYYLKSVKFVFFIIALFAFGCQREPSSEIKLNKKFVSVNTDSKVLRGFGIQSYGYYSPDANELLIEFNNDRNENKISYTVDADSRVHKYLFTNKNLSFTFTFEEKKKSFSLLSSKGDHVEAVAQGRNFINKATGKTLDPTWFTKINFDYELIVRVMEMVQETQATDRFVSAITILDKKVNDAILIKKASAMKKRIPTLLSTQPCSQGYNTCLAEGKFGTTYTIACDFSHDTLGSACSNQYCIGYCSYIGCDCLCGFMSYGCYCTAKGRYCTGFAE